VNRNASLAATGGQTSTASAVIYFPKPYPDEACASVLIRACRHTGQGLPSILAALGETRSRGEALRHTAALSSLSCRVGTSISDFLQSHTFIPYATCFLPSDAQQRYIQWVLSTHTAGAERFRYINRLPPALWPKRFCFQCASEDQKRLGESYWRRQHCLPGMTFCPIHLAPLTECSQGERGSLALMLPCDILATPVSTPAPSHMTETFTRLSLDALNGRMVHLDYRRVLTKMGHTIPFTLAEAKYLSEAVLKAIGPPLLLELNRTGSARASSLWPAHVATGPASAFPTPRHIAMHSYLLAQDPSFLPRGRMSRQN